MCDKHSNDVMPRNKAGNSTFLSHYRNVLSHDIDFLSRRRL